MSCPPAAQLGRDEPRVRHVQQSVMRRIRCSSYLWELLIGVSDPPQLLEQLQLLLCGIRAIDRGRELIQVVRTIDVLLGGGEQRLSRLRVEPEQSLQRRHDLPPFFVWATPRAVNRTSLIRN
jgi:hypothetical protein